jgi:hypothetical protein
MGNSSGPLQLRAADAQIGIAGVGNDASGTARVVNIEQARNSRIRLQEIKGAVSINADRSRVEAEEITGEFRVDSTSDRVRVNRIHGALRIKSKDGAVEVEDARNMTTIEATGDVTVRNFRGPLSVTSREGSIDLETSEKLNGNLSVTSDEGRIRVSIPENSGFRLAADAGSGRVKAQGFDDAEWERKEKSYIDGYNITKDSPQISLRSNRGDIQLRSSVLPTDSHDKDE